MPSVYNKWYVHSMLLHWATHLQVIRDKHLASLFNHGLRFELFLTEPMPAGVKRLLSRHTRQGNIRRIRVKGRQHVVAVSDGWSREWWARGGRRWGRWLQAAWRGAWWYKHKVDSLIKSRYYVHAFRMMGLSKHYPEDPQGGSSRQQLNPLILLLFFHFPIFLP